MSAEGQPKSIRAMIVDDEALARSNVVMSLRSHTEIEIVSECASGMEALTGIRHARPDLLFLDVEMPECDGFDVLEMLGGDLPPAIVFVTAYDKYALRAFEAGALDYLLKPFDNDRFERALGRAKERVAQARNSPRAREHIAVKSSGQLTFIQLSEIDWIEAADYYSCLHVGAKSHLLRRSMADLDDDLDPSAFCRIHRSTIVRLDRVRGLKLNENGEYDVLLHNGTVLRMSRRYRKELQMRLDQAHIRRAPSDEMK
jgi:two-component system LytT family response regulator